MFELIFLGTSASAPSIKRGLSSLVVKHDEFRFMVDCGEGTQRQILKSGVGFKRLNHILLTHGHLDHILGLAGLLSTFMRWEAIEEVNIYASRHTMDRVSDLINGVVLRGNQPPMPLNMLEIKPGLIFQSKHFDINAFPVDHRGSSSQGYRFTEKSHRPFLSDVAEALGVPNGPCRRDLIQGQSITLADGRLIRPEDVLGKERPGVSLAIVGDVGKLDKLREHVAGADMMVIEATYLAEDVEMAQKFGHSTAADVARLAADSGVGKLILTHVSRRYRDDEVLAEARAIFPETYLANDFDRFEVRKPGQPE